MLWKVWITHEMQATVPLESVHFWVSAHKGWTFQLCVFDFKSIFGNAPSSAPLIYLCPSNWIADQLLVFRSFGSSGILLTVLACSRTSDFSILVNIKHRFRAYGTICSHLLYLFVGPAIPDYCRPLYRVKSISVQSSLYPPVPSECISFVFIPIDIFSYLLMQPTSLWIAGLKVLII